MHASDGEKHVAGVQWAWSAGAARRSLYSLIIKKQKKGAFVKFENIRYKAKGGESVKVLESFTVEMI